MTETPQVTDSHCHLDFPDFEGQLPDIVNRSVEAGVGRMVTICTRLSEEPKVRSIAEGFDPVFFAAANHPMNAASEPMATLDQLLDIAKHPKMIGIGETGLDYHYTSETAGVQKDSLLVHIEAARQSGLPLIIHSRDADDDMADILTREVGRGSFACVMHCFSSSRELAEATLEIGCYLSMSGIATFKKSQELRDIFAACPTDRILVETDAPYLAPTPHRGKRNEPAYTTLTAAVGAELFGMKYADFVRQTEANFDRIFTKAAAWHSEAA